MEKENLIKQTQEKFPFLTGIEYCGKEFVGIVVNHDSSICTFYDLDALPSEKFKKEILDLGEIWWWESNRMIPISIFMREEMEKFKSIIMIMATKDVRVVIGPCTNLNSLAMKRTKRKSVQLVRKPK